MRACHSSAQHQNLPCTLCADLSRQFSFRIQRGCLMHALHVTVCAGKTGSQHRDHRCHVSSAASSQRLLQRCRRRTSRASAFLIQGDDSSMIRHVCLIIELLLYSIQLSVHHHQLWCSSCSGARSTIVKQVWCMLLKALFSTRFITPIINAHS